MSKFTKLLLVLVVFGGVSCTEGPRSDSQSDFSPTKYSWVRVEEYRHNETCWLIFRYLGGGGLDAQRVDCKEIAHDP